MQMSNIIDYCWRTGSGTVGFVAYYKYKNGDPKGGWTAVVGTGHGYSTETDVIHIANNGGRLSKGEAMAFFPNLDPNKYVEN